MLITVHIGDIETSSSKPKLTKHYQMYHIVNTQNKISIKNC